MAQDQQDNLQNTSSVDGSGFNKGLIKDFDESSTPEGSYTHARNATKYTVLGNLNTRSNEPSNLLCNSNIPYTIIGTIHLYGDVWAIFSTDDTHSEIGIFDDSICQYTRSIHDPCIKSTATGCVCDSTTTTCLNFNRKNLIIGVSKQNFDCSWQVYFADGNNPDRTINITSPEFIKDCKIVDGCLICTETCQIDCNAIRLARLVDSPCLNITRGNNGGNLQNGSYFAVVAYSINNLIVTDYFPPSNVQSIFEHDNLSGSLEINIGEMDTFHFDEFQLVIVRTINQQTSAKLIGTYSTRTKHIFLDQISESLTDIPIELIPFRSPVYEKSEGIFQVGTYAIRVAPTTKFDFNYQPIANRITTKWIITEYPSDYYRKGGNITSYLRDEVYPFFIRWVYDTGDRSSSYHIPGRAAIANEKDPTGSDNIPSDIDPNFPNTLPERWEVYNTASGNPIPHIIQQDGGVVIGKGQMGYWESTEVYPDDQPEIWNQSDNNHTIKDPSIGIVGTQWSIYPGDLPVQLCGKPIRHHRMPDNLSTPGVTEHFFKYPNNVIKIRVLGVEFGKIRAPRDNEGRLISGIVGYEILRGSREGNKTVIAKGIINNTRQYNLTTSNFTSNKQGLYPNYPYNPLGEDPTVAILDQSNNGGLGALGTAPALQEAVNVNKSVFTFHSPDTQFNNPFLSMKEIKLYGELGGDVQGNFEEVNGHPKEKLLGDISFVLAAILGIASAGLAIVGRKTDTLTPSSNNDTGLLEVGVSNTLGILDPAGLVANATSNSLGIALATIELDPLTSTSGILNVLSAAFVGNNASVNEDAKGIAVSAARVATSFNAGAVPPLRDSSRQWSDFDYMPPLLKLVGGLITFSYYWTLGTDSALRLIESLIPYRQFAYRYRSHGFSDGFLHGNAVPTGLSSSSTTRRELVNSNYLDNQFQDFGTNYRINNLYRGKAVILETNTPINNPNGIDNTVQCISSATQQGRLSKDKNGNVIVNSEFTTHTTAYYAALKIKLRDQYGQMTSIQEVPITCVFNSLDSLGNQILSDQTTGPIYGGDTYITRYTEKNTFFYFYNWLIDQPDGFEFNYRLYYMINFPRFWADFTRFEASDFLTNFINAINPFSGQFGQLNLIFPDSKALLDRTSGSALSLTNVLKSLSFGIKNAYFYLFQSGVRDFYVESEINTDLRDWGNTDAERYYDPYRYTDTASIFAPNIIKSGNFFKYDSSLSISRLFINFISWGNQQPRSYNPTIAETCFSFYPFRAIYSLPQNLENKKDFWRSYLTNNYKDFNSKITTIEKINKNGAIILFETASPIQFQGVDSLVTDLGTKITLGDGGLFSQPLQYTTNANESFEYGSCQNRLSVINTPLGLYWISENQGKIFLMTDTMKDITLSTGLKFWFKKYLPYFLLKDFPDFELTDNSIVGVGCQATYDNQLELLYFCKKDFRLLPQYIGRITYTPSCLLSQCNPQTEVIFRIDGVQANIVVGDPQYFEDCSWTVSYDPKDGSWISYHDWHPDLLIPSKNNFLSIKDNQIWRHNNRTDSFCNFYGKDYPFELEYVTATAINVNTVRNLEYYLECYKYDSSGINKYHLLDFNFDHATISNTEQVSGVLNLVLKSKNDPLAMLTYPRINPTSIDINYTKEEQKYRFSQFWDITDDRGEFTNAQRVIWLNDSNGYTRTLNPANLNYQKNSFQRKKFRHYLTKCSLVRAVSGNINMIMKVSTVKLLDTKR